MKKLAKFKKETIKKSALKNIKGGGSNTTGERNNDDEFSNTTGER